MQHLRIASPAHLTDDVLAVFTDDPAVSHLAVLRGASIEPAGDIVLADVAREATNEIVDRLVDLGIPELGTIHVEPVTTWVSRAGFDAERHTPGSSADAVIWADVTQRAYEESELNWTYLAFMTLATLLASIAIIVDSQILVIGAMVLGPEFIAIAALGLALVRRRRTLFGLAARTLFVGFAVAIALTTLAALAARALGWIVTEDVTGARPGTDFIYTPDKWSFIVASSPPPQASCPSPPPRSEDCPGCSSPSRPSPPQATSRSASPSAHWDEVTGSAIQLALNISGMILAGWATLALQHLVWNRKARHRQRLLAGGTP